MVLEQIVKMSTRPAIRIAILVAIILTPLSVWAWSQASKIERFTIGTYRFDFDPLFARERQRDLKDRYVEVGPPLWEFSTPLPEKLRQTEGIELGDDKGVMSPAAALDKYFLDWRGRLPGATNLTARFGVDYQRQMAAEPNLDKFAGDSSESLETIYVGYADGAPDLVVSCRNPEDGARPVCQFWRNWKPGLNYSVRFGGSVESWADIDSNVRAFIAEGFVD